MTTSSSHAPETLIVVGPRNFATFRASPMLVKPVLPAQSTFSVPARTTAADDSTSSAKERLIVTLKRDMVYPQFAAFLRMQSGGMYSVAVVSRVPIDSRL